MDLIPETGTPAASNRPAASAPAWRRWLYEVIFESDTPAGKAFDLVLLVAICVSVLVVVLESVKAIRAEHAVLLRDLEWGFTALFTIEYFARLLCVRRPLVYARSFYGVVDLLAVLPSFISLFTAANYVMAIRILRLLRVFRVLKLAHFLQETETLMDALRASRRKVMVFVFAVLALVTVMGTLMYLVEGEARVQQHPAQHLLGDRNADHGGLRRHHAPDESGTLPRQLHHDHGLRDHRGADGNFLTRAATGRPGPERARLPEVRDDGVGCGGALLPAVC